MLQGPGPSTMTAAVEILIVEDSPNDLVLTMRALRKLQLASHVVAASDGQEALDFLFVRGAFAERRSNGGPHVILLDLKLPRIDGIEVLRRIKLDERTRNIPVVMVTCSAMDRDVEETDRLGVNGYLVKPIDLDSFAKTFADLGLLADHRSLSDP